MTGQILDDATCTISIQFLWRLERLLTVVNMRSWDMQLGMPYDITMFGMLSQAVRAILGISSGDVIVNTTSAHIYVDSYKPTRLWHQSCAWVPEHFDSVDDAQKWAVAQLIQIREGEEVCLKS